MANVCSFKLWIYSFLNLSSQYHWFWDQCIADILDLINTILRNIFVINAILRNILVTNAILRNILVCLGDRKNQRPDYAVLDQLRIPSDGAF